MPLWNLYCPVGAYTPEDKQELAERITALYANVGLPKFYVSVLFHELPRDSFLVGGEPADDFVRIWVDHIARRVADNGRRSWLDKINSVVAPFVEQRGYRWELHIDDTPNDQWTIQGLTPPPADSEAEKLWAADNKPQPYEVA